ncbi:MAG: SPOR domain-containing protein [Runella zeae]
MTSVLDYTRKLLYEHDCVVLPDFGGFLAYFSHAFYSEQNALYHAPQKRIAFNEALKLDDGLLVHYLTINEQISREEAQKKVRAFVENLKTTLQEKGTYVLEGIGELSKNEEGKIQFEPLTQVNFYGEGFGLKSIKLDTTPAAEMSEQPKDWTQSDRAPEELSVEVPRRRRYRVGMYLGVILLVGSALIGGLTQFSNQSLTSSLNPFELVTTVKGWLVVDKKSNVVQESASVKEQVSQKEEVKAEEAPAAITPEIAVNPEVIPVVAEPKKAPKPVVEEAVSLASDEKINYWVIAGGFSKKENALKLEKKLKRNGYESASILNPDAAENQLIIVTAIGCENAKKAKLQLARVSALSGASAYVMHTK